MTDPYTPTTEEVRALAYVIDPAIYPDINQLTGSSWKASLRAGRKIMESDWLAAHDAQVRAEVIDWFNRRVSNGACIAAREHFVIPVPSNGTESEAERFKREFLGEWIVPEPTGDPQ